MLARTVRATIEKHGMFATGDRVVVALSGGPDSVALLHMLNSLKGIYRIDLRAAHLEHGIRGEESIQDMKFVEDLCRSLSIPLATGHEDVPQIARTRKISLEAVARDVRYKFLEGVLGEHRASKIATGHNANDQAETLLLNMLRGSGMAGMSGVRPAIEDRIVRPLIDASREEIEAYLKEKNLSYRIDSSNLDERHERNRIRQILLPLIEKEFNPNIVETLARTAGVFSAVNQYLDERISEALKACTRSEEGRISVDLEALKDVPHAIRLFVIYSVLRDLEGDAQVVSFDIINAVLILAERSKSGSRIDIGSGIMVLKEYDSLVIGRDLALVEPYLVNLEIPGTVVVEQANCSFTTEVLKERPGTGEVFRSGKAAYFDFDQLEMPLIVRSWREGDRFVPFGLSGTKKVHDVFTDEKVSVSQRAEIPIICDREGIMWVAGVRRADRARITDETRTILRITYNKDD